MCMWWVGEKPRTREIEQNWKRWEFMRVKIIFNMKIRARALVSRQRWLRDRVKIGCGGERERERESRCWSFGIKDSHGNMAYTFQCMIRCSRWNSGFNVETQTLERERRRILLGAYIFRQSELPHSHFNRLKYVDKYYMPTIYMLSYMKCKRITHFMHCCNWITSNVSSYFNFLCGI